MRPVDESVMTPDDIRETLTFLRGHVLGGKQNMEKVDVFSFGIPQRGRFRVSFITQRGSYVARIVRIPGEVPPPASIIDDRVTADRAMAMFKTLRRGLLLISGAPLSRLNALVYGLIEKGAASEQRVVTIIEHDTTFLLKHGKSIVVQCEYGPDNETIESTIRSAMMLAPDTIYIHDLSARADLESALKAAKAHVLVVVTMSTLDADRLFPGGVWGGDPQLLCGWWKAEEAAVEGKIRLNLDGGVKEKA
jgi:twitching motility protein PilT